MMRHSAKQGGRMEKRVFCGKHFRRSVEHIPVIVPVTIKYKLDGKEYVKRDCEYQLRCPVCWEQEKNKS